MKSERTVAHIGDVAALVRGVTYKKQDSSSEPAPGRVPLLRATNINGELDFTGLVYVPDTCVSADQYLVQGDSVLAASSGSLSVVGKSAPLRQAWEGTFGAFCYALRPNPAYIAPFYLSYFLQTSEYRSQVSRLAAGVNINNLKRQHLEHLELPLVSLAQQQRIVEAIESYFTRLDDAVATLERVQRNLRRYRASVLKAAIEGRLVPTEAELARAEGRDYEPASVLLERILVQRRRRWEEAQLAKMKAKGKPHQDDKWKAKYTAPVAPDEAGLPGLPDGWCWTTVDQLASSEQNSLSDGPFGSNLKTAHYTESGPRVVRLQNIGEGEFIDAKAYISEEHFEKLSKHRILAGDLVVASLGETLPRACMIPAALGRAIVKADCLRFSPDSLLCDPRYVLMALNARPTRSRTESLIHGVGRPRIGLTLLRQVTVPLPPRAEQKRVVAEAECLLSIEENTIKALESLLTRCHSLRQSILKWAFEGRLVDQDPTDEPASRLLERIQVERESTNGQPRRSPRRRRARSPRA